MHSLQLDARILIEAPTVTRGSSGGIKTTWAEHLTCWAQRRDQSGLERAAASAGGAITVARVEFVLRVREGINEQMRVIHRARHHNIQHVKPLADHPGWMVLTCDTGANDG